MRYFLFDASVVHHFYIPNAKYKKVLDYLLSENQRGQSFFYLPSFCVAEVLNSFAKYRFRFKTLTAEKYKEVRDNFLDHVRYRKLFYCYDLHRYHNLNSDDVFEIEHSYDTEYTATETTFGDDLETIGKMLKEKDKNDSISKHYLSTYDILLISMGMELRRILKKNIYMLTKDKRLYNVCNEGFNQGKRFARPLHLPQLTVQFLSRL